MPHPVASVDKMLRRCRAALGMHIQIDSHYLVENSSFFFGSFSPSCDGLSLAVHSKSGTGKKTIVCHQPEPGSIQKEPTVGVIVSNLMKGVSHSGRRDYQDHTDLNDAPEAQS